MKKNKRLIKNFCKFENFDFNTIAELFKNYHTKSIHSSMWNNEYVLNSTFQIRDVQYNKMFSDLYKNLLHVPQKTICFASASLTNCGGI